MVVTLRIREVLPATPRARIVRIDLEGRGFDYAAGQAVLVGNHAQEPRKPYSIAAAPEDARRDGCLELLVGIDGEPHTGPPLMLERGAAVDVEGPVGTFAFPSSPRERRFVFIAGGTGIAPLRAMLRHALHIPHVPRSGIGLLYSARAPDEFAYEPELRTLADRGAIELRQTVTRVGEAAAWRGSRGRIGRGELQQLVHDPETLCFICGPRALVNEMPKLLETLGVAGSRIRTEEWS